MALRTVSDTGGNWNSTATWVGGVVPVAGDTVDFTATSGDLTVNVSTAILSGIDFTNYVGTITFNNTIQLNTNLNLGTGGYTQAGASGLRINADTTISGTTIWTRTFLIAANAAVTLTLSNNLNLSDLSLDGNAASLTFVLGGNVVSISNNISFIGTGTYTLNIPHDLQITNLTLGTSGGNRTCTINGLFTLSISGNLTQNQSNGITSGTTSILLNGTGTWSNASTGSLRNNLTIDTTGTITIIGTVHYGAATLTHIQGEVITTGSTLNIVTSTTLNCGNMNDVITNKWNNIVFDPSTYTLISDLNCQNFTGGGGSVTFTNSGGNIYISGNLLHNVGGGILGTASINLIGTGTWTDTAANSIRNDLIINTTGTITIVGNIYYTTGTLTYISGTVITDSSTLNINISTTLDTDGITWNNVTLSGTSQTFTLTSNLNCQNLTSASATINGFNVNVNGNLTANGIVLKGTSTIVLTGTGLWTATNASNTFRAPIIINTNGIITLANSLYHDGDLTYIKGIVKSNNTTIDFGSSIKTLINLHKLIFKNVVLGSLINLTMNEFFSGSPSVVTNISSSNINNNYTITFQDGFEKIAKFVNISNCTLSKPLQLLITTNSKKNSRNRGIRYINQSPNGIAKGEPSVNLTTLGAGGLLSDPTNL